MIEVEKQTIFKFEFNFDPCVEIIYGSKIWKRFGENILERTFGFENLWFSF